VRSDADKMDKARHIYRPVPERTCNLEHPPLLRLPTVSRLSRHRPRGAAYDCTPRASCLHICTFGVDPRIEWRRPPRLPGKG